MKHIGMDLHSTTAEACVRNGKGEVVLRRHQIPTTPLDLEKFIVGIPGPKRVIIEECQMADWVTRALEPHVTEIIRCQPQYNKLISASEDKCDGTDSVTLSELLFLNRFKPVHHPKLPYRCLREVVRAYWIASRELTRAKNRLKGFFLFNGLHETGDAVYSVRNRSRYLEKLQKKPGSNVELARVLYERLDYCRQLKAKHLRLLREAGKPVKPLVRLLMTIPGIGAIFAYTLVAFLEEGQRLRNKRKLWSYAGLGVKKHESRGIGIRRASCSGSRMVKHAAMSAAATIASERDNNALRALWEKEIGQKVDPERARRNLARKILVIAQRLLRSKQRYSDERVMV